MRAAIVIPAYNHADRIAGVVTAAKRLDLPILVVDDGSTDHTPAVLASIPGITVLRHPLNLGKGAALRTGFVHAVRNYDWALTFDADGQHLPLEGAALLEAALSHGGRPIVIGCRQGMGETHVPWTSRFGRGFSNFWVWAAGGPRVADSQSGFRLYPLPETLQLDVQARRYQFEVEVLVLARRQGIDTIETPVSVVYQPRGERISHFQPWRDFWRNSATFSRLICGRILGRRP